MRLNIIPSKHSVKLENGMYQTTMKGSIIINYTPEGEFDLISKETVDKMVTGIDLSKLEATISTNNFPAYKGDFTKTNGNYFLNGSTGYTSGHMTYAVNDKGLVTKSSDKIPPSAWGSVKYDKVTVSTLPKTPEEMGIKDAITLDGKGVTNQGFQYYEAGLRDNSPVTFNKAVTFFNPLVKYNVGDIVLLPLDTNEADIDFLDLNGSKLNKKTYSELYGIIGDKFNYDFGTNNGMKTMGIPWKYTFFIATLTQPVLPTVKKFTKLNFESIGGSAYFNTNNLGFICGGTFGNYSNPLNTVYKIDFDRETDDITKITKIGDLPKKRAFSKAININNTIYIIGGLESNGTSVNLLFNKLDNNGDLTTWKEKPNTSFKYDRCNATIFVIQNRIYVIGGFRYDYVNKKKITNGSLEWANIDEEGNIGPWHYIKNSNVNTTEGTEWIYYNDFALCRSSIYKGLRTLNFSTYITAQLNYISEFSAYHETGNNLNLNCAFTPGGSGMDGGRGHYLFASGYTTSPDFKGDKSVGFHFIRTGRTNTGGTRIEIIDPVYLDPRPRFYNSTFVQGKKLYVMGGIIKESDDTITDSKLSAPIMTVDINTNLRNYLSYSKVHVDDVEFTLPLTDPVVFKDGVFKYCIYSGPKK